MPYRSTLIAIVAMVAVATGIFFLFQQRTAKLWLRLAIHPEIQDTLATAGEDLKRFAKQDPENSEAYRTRFDQIQTLRNHLFILETHGRDVVMRYQLLLMGLLLGIVGIASAFHIVIQRKTSQRIDQLRQPLAVLAGGTGTLSLPAPSNDVIGKVAEMIGQTAGLVTQQREKLRYLEHLSGWQEASRRHAHEMRTPLTAARLEVERLEEWLADTGDLALLRPAMQASTHSILEELDRIKRFTQEFTAFARLREPQTERIPLASMLEEFCTLFAKAWSNLTLEWQAPAKPLELVAIDAEMIRQVWVNLANNASKSMNKPMGLLQFTLKKGQGFQEIHVCDNGPGIPAALRSRVFEPYCTTRKIGEGMGLGLSISRKIMLDHHGDLVLTQSSPEGTCFLMQIPVSKDDLQKS